MRLVVPGYVLSSVISLACLLLNTSSGMRLKRQVYHSESNESGYQEGPANDFAIVNQVTVFIPPNAHSNQSPNPRYNLPPTQRFIPSPNSVRRNTRPTTVPRILPNTAPRSPPVVQNPEPVRRLPVNTDGPRRRNPPPQRPTTPSPGQGVQNIQNNNDRQRNTIQESTPSAPVEESFLVGNIIDQAVRSVRTEDRFIDLRLLLGLDKTIDQFTTLEPTVFSESPLDVAALSRQSRIINWIGTMLRDFKLSTSIQGALRHPKAIAANLECPYKRPTCDIDDKFRTIDGTCNNINKPIQGSAFTPMLRELSPVYENDPLGKIDLPRTRGKLGPLPSARLVSQVVHADRGVEERETRWSMQLTLWGQMLAHDLSDRAPGKGSGGAVMSCCNQTIRTPFCFGIEVPENDEFRERGLDCLDFTRSAEVTDIDCTLGRREQLNQASSYIDAGFIYGVTQEKLDILRLKSRGMLATSMNGHLPIIPHPHPKASLQGFAFFATGDDRVNEHTGLMGIETVWVREHNRVAEILGGLNPAWNDEKIFQETKRIVSAVVQHITYNEYLPQIVGTQTMDQYDLWPQKSGYFTGYSPVVDASVSNAFTTAVYRFGHSMIRSKFRLMDKSFNSSGDEPLLHLKDTFFTSVTFLETEHRMMRGTMMDQSEPCDRMLSSDLRNNLHQTRQGNGRDLAALNIQRGRDHGLPSYTAWRRFYGFSPISDFTNDTNGFVDHPDETVQLLKQIYSHPDDVDLWTAGVSEIPVTDGAVGPLFSAMIGRQFKALREGDRYFYESDDQPVPFTPEQLTEIRRVTYSSILCYNLNFKTIQPEAFLLTSSTKNDKIPCTEMRGMNFLPWRETS